MSKSTAFATALAVYLGGLVAVHAQTDEVKVFKPDSPWTADYGDDYCQLARSFSNGDEKVLLSMDRIEPGPGLRVILIGNAIKLLSNANQLGYRFLPSGEDRKANFIKAQTLAGQQYLNLGDAPVAAMKSLRPPIIMRVDFETSTPLTAASFGAPLKPLHEADYNRQTEQDNAGSLKGLLLTDGAVDPIEIDTGNLKPVIAALQSCTDDLLTHWGIDPESFYAGSGEAVPLGEASNWLPKGTIPAKNSAGLIGGTNQIRLMVDEAGRPASCHIHYPSLDTETNGKICETLMVRAKFRPARDSNGKPVASFFMADLEALSPPFQRH